MQFSFSLAPTTTLSEHTRIVSLAEGWGFDLAWCPDQGFMRDPFVAMAHTATLANIPLGLSVTNPFSRHPLQIARAFGALSELRDNGMILGFGAGELIRMRRKIGAPEAPLVPTLRECIGVIRKLFAGEEVSSDHAAFKLDKVKLEFVPKNRIPIYIASTSPAAFALAGEVADGVIVGDTADPVVMRGIVNIVREAARNAGRDPQSVRVVAWVATLLTDDRDTVYEQLRLPVVGRAISTSARQTRECFGVSEENIALIKAALARKDVVISPQLVPDSLIEAMTLVGSAEAIIERIKALQDVGVDMIGCRMPAALTNRFPFEQNLQRIATEIIPQFRMR